VEEEFLRAFSRVDRKRNIVRLFSARAGGERLEDLNDKMMLKGSEMEIRRA
jgi:hypothetical protein